MLEPNDERMMIAGELRVLGDLAQRSPEDALMVLREMLRDRDRWAQGSPSQRLLAADLLDAVCRRLEAAGIAPAEYFVGAREMYPTTPDDTSALTPNEGGDDV